MNNEKLWELHGHVTRVMQGTNKRGEEYQMLGVGGHQFWLEPEHRNGFQEGDEVVVSGRYVRDVRTQNGYEAIQEIMAVTKVGDMPNIKPVQRATVQSTA